MSFHKVMISIIAAAHWSLTVVDNYKKEIRQYDSIQQMIKFASIKLGNYVHDIEKISF